MIKIALSVLAGVIIGATFGTTVIANYNRTFAAARTAAVRVLEHEQPLVIVDPLVGSDASASTYGLDPERKTDW
jgi:hypothetical protein